MSTLHHCTPSTTNILVIEDDLGVAALVTDVLHYGGYHSRTVPNGAQAFDLLSEYAPSLILLDLHTPGFTWQQIVARLDLRGCAMVPIIAMTGAGPLFEVEASTRITTVIYKPFDLNEFLACIAHYCVRMPNNLHVHVSAD